MHLQSVNTQSSKKFSKRGKQHSASQSKCSMHCKTIAANMGKLLYL